MNMIERVARAMAVTDSGPEGSPLFDIHWREFGEGYLTNARAAIEAMREPTEAMEEAGRDANPRGPTVCPDCDAAAIFTAMIDAALEEGK